MKLIELPIKEIHKDFFFCFRSEFESSALERSIRMSGIRTPLHVQSIENGYRLISGFRRYRIAVSLKLGAIPVTVVPDDVTADQAFHEALQEHLSIHDLNLVEKAKILRILDELKVTHERLVTDFLPLLELPSKKEIVKRVRSVLKRHPAVQDYIEKYDLSLKQAMLFNHLSDEEQHLFAGLASHLEIRSVELSAIIKSFRDIAGRDAVSIVHIYDELEIDGIVKDSQIMRSQQIQRIKESLHQNRYPRLTSWNRRLQALEREIDLPEHVRLSWDQSLERPGIRLQIHIQSAREMDDAIGRLSKPKARERIAGMLDLV